MEKSDLKRESIGVYSENNLFLIMCALFFNTLLIVDCVRMFAGSDSIVYIAVRYGLYILLGIYAYGFFFVSNKGKIHSSLFGVILSMFLIAGVSYVICPEISTFFSYYFPLLILRLIPAMLFMFYMEPETLHDLSFKMQKYRFLWIIYALIGTVYISSHRAAWDQYAQNFGFNLLLPACFSLYKFLNDRKYKWAIYMIAFLTIILLRGSRTALLCFVVFAVAYYLAFENTNLTRRKVISFFFFAILIILFLFNIENIIHYLGSIFPSSRTLAVLKMGFKFDSGRSEIHSVVIDGIKQNWLTFHGFFSDRVYYSQSLGVKMDITNYPHNFFLEFIYQFGIPLAAIVLPFLVRSIFTAFRYAWRYKNSVLLFFFVFLFSSGLVRLFFSDSYLTTVEFYLFLGLIMQINYHSKRRGDCP